MAIKINWQDLQKRIINWQEVQKVMLNWNQIRPSIPSTGFDTNFKWLSSRPSDWTNNALSLTDLTQNGIKVSGYITTQIGHTYTATNANLITQIIEFQWDGTVAQQSDENTFLLYAGVYDTYGFTIPPVVWYEDGHFYTRTWWGDSIHSNVNPNTTYYVKITYDIINRKYIVEMSMGDWIDIITKNESDWSWISLMNILRAYNRFMVELSWVGLVLQRVALSIS